MNKGRTGGINWYSYPPGCSADGALRAAQASPAEVALNLESVAEQVPRELWAEAKELGLIRAEIPIP